MKKEIVFLLIGVAAGCLLMRQYKILKQKPELVKLGDKSSVVKKLQQDINYLSKTNTGVLDETGMFDKNTKLAVLSMFNGTTVLHDEKTAGVEKSFVNNLNLIINKVK